MNSISWRTTAYCGGPVYTLDKKIPLEDLFL
jgi:hypothetical protein